MQWDETSTPAVPWARPPPQTTTTSTKHQHQQDAILSIVTGNVNPDDLTDDQRADALRVLDAAIKKIRG